VQSEVYQDTVDQLFSYLDFLQGEAEQSRTFSCLFKATSLSGLGLGALTAFTLPGWGLIVLGASAVGYFGTMLHESRKTGRTMPLPLVTLSLDTVLQGVVRGSGGDDDGDDLIDYHYLDAKQKSDFALLSTMLHDIAEVLAQHPTEASRRVAWANMSRRFHQTYARALKENPDLVAMASNKEDLKRLVFADAEELLALTTEGLNQPALPPAPAPSPLAPGPATRLNAVDVVAVEVEAPPDPWYEKPVTPSPVHQPEPMERASVSIETMPAAEYVGQVSVLEGRAVTTLAAPTTALEHILQSPYQSRAFFGSQRSGKSMLVAIGSQELARRGTKTYHINLLSFAKDEGQDEDAEYTRHCFKSVRGDISKMGAAEVANLIGDAIAAVHQWWDEQNALLIIDEWAYTAAKFGQYADLLKEFVILVSGKISALTSSGMKRTVAIWTIAPTMVAGNMLECGGKSIKSMKLTYVTVPPGKAVEWQGQAVGFDEQLFDQVAGNFAITYPTMTDAAGQDRIAYVGDRWLPLGTNPAMLMAPIPAAVPEPPTPAPSSGPAAEPGPQLDLFEATPPPSSTRIGRAIDKCTAPLTKEILEWLRGIGPGKTFVASSACTTAWSQKAEKQGKLTRRAESITEVVLEPLAGMGLLERDGSGWRVCE
jgi:hypothetical protein